MRRTTARRGVRCGLAAALLASCTHTPPVHLAPEPAEGAAVSAPVPVKVVRHRVEPGETVWAISFRYGVSTTALIARNGIREVRKLHVGRVLEIPEPGRTDGAAAHASRPTTSEGVSRASARAAYPRDVSYQVEPGNTRPRITRHHGMSVQALAGSHRIENVEKRRVGRRQATSAPAPPEKTVEPASNSHEPPVRGVESVAAETSAPGIDAVDEVLTSGEERLRAAKFDEAMELAVQALRFLENAPDTAGVGTQIARAEMLAATVHIAHARKGAAIRSLRRALRADQHLELDPGTTSPKVIGFLEEAQAEVD